jgi:aspartate racemase
MEKGKCIGLLGGIGVGAANHYYSALAKAHTDRGLILDLVMVHADMNQSLAANEANDPIPLAKYFNTLIHRLQAAGSDFAVIPSVTSHFPLEELRRISPLPIVDLFTPLNVALAARDIHRAAIFGTRWVQQSRLHGRVPTIEIVPSQPGEAELIHSTYMELAWTGVGTPAQHATLTTLAHELIRREQLDAILFAGTDLSVLFSPSNTDFPHVDIAALHIAAIMEEAIR